MEYLVEGGLPEALVESQQEFQENKVEHGVHAVEGEDAGCDGTHGVW